jgi:hypothetical protein
LRSDITGAHGAIIVCREAVMELTLTCEENELLLEILQERYRDLQKEIRRTDHHEFKLVLKNKEILLESVLNKLKVTQLVNA